MVALMTWNTTSPPPPISIVADVVPVPVFNWHTECYSSGKSAFRDNTSVLLTLTCKRFSSVLSVAQANEIESAPALSNVVQRDTECYRSSALKTVRLSRTTSEDDEPADGAVPDGLFFIDNNDGNLAVFGNFRLCSHGLICAHGVGEHNLRHSANVDIIGAR